MKALLIFVAALSLAACCACRLSPPHPAAAGPNPCAIVDCSRIDTRTIA